MKMTTLRKAIVGALALSAGTAVTAAPLGEHVNGFYNDAAGETRRGLGIQYIPIGNDQGALFVAYYAYDDATGENVWVSGTALATPDISSVTLELSAFEGGNFGGATGAPTGTVVGEGTFTFNACGDVSWDFTSSSSDLSDFNDTLVSSNLSAGLPAPTACAVYDKTFSGCPDFAIEGIDAGTCIIDGGEYTEDLALTNDTIWILNGAVYIGARDTAENNNSISIEAGTRIIGGDTNSLLAIQRGAKIIASGEQYAPIVLTGLEGEAGGAGQWGGLVISGTAPINTCENTGQCTSEGEGESGTYGGDDPFDNSGILRYVRVQYAGFRFRDTNELNGIAFQGVGAGTTVENVQVHANEDDGVEFFGGTVNVRNLVLTDVKDDSLDWTEGWQGNIQGLLVVQDQDFDAVDAADRGIEADNLESNNDAQPRSLPKIANATFIGRPDTTGATLRRGTGANITNAIFSGFGKCLDIDSDATFAAAGSPDALSGTLTIQNSIVNCATNFDEEDGDAWSVAAWFNAAGSNQELDPALENVVFPPANADYLQGAELDSERFGAFFQNLGHIGAFGEGNVWTAGWTLQNFNR